MKIKRYMAPDMRRAIHLVRREEGADAVILSSRSVDGGVEIVAASDYDQQLVAEMSLASSMRQVDVALAAGGDDTLDERSATDSAPAQVAQRMQAVGEDKPTTAVELDPALKAMQAQLDVMQGMLREQFAQLSWADLRTFQPERALLMRGVASLDLDPELAEELVTAVSQPGNPEGAWREVVFGLARRLRVVARDPIDSGGVFALVGPTGVGKTTTLAKLAARHCLRHGRESLALITTDSFRMAAQRQLDAYGEILGVDVHRADTADTLQILLQKFSNKRLVLVDTAGMAPRDCRLAAYLGQLEGCRDIQRYLVLSANAQRAAMNDAVHAFGGSGLAGIALTKLDEVPALGPALSVLIRTGLPAAWLCDGQRVPEDLKVARAVHLVSWAIRRPAEKDTQDSPLPPAFERHASSKEMAHAAV
ncbi:MAG: flagellar biosynthesis protein FlhF [Gammaproteobacteria bacterium]|nr:MAG: flagellar biosynthesis protein FlhF [Gammaproteobacteria bacterium]